MTGWLLPRCIARSLSAVLKCQARHWLGLNCEMVLWCCRLVRCCFGVGQALPVKMISPVLVVRIITGVGWQMMSKVTFPDGPYNLTSQ